MLSHVHVAASLRLSPGKRQNAVTRRRIVVPFLEEFPHTSTNFQSNWYDHLSSPPDCSFPISIIQANYLFVQPYIAIFLTNPIPALFALHHRPFIVVAHNLWKEFLVRLKSG